MRVSNETYMSCTVCGAEATGLEDINKIFGYKIVNEIIQPYSECRKCRDNLEEKVYQEEEWNTAAGWGRRIHISRKVFDSYLIELGYLEYDPKSSRRWNKLAVTEKGREHSTISNSKFRKSILWDFDILCKVAKQRASQAIVHDTCPKCSAYLDTMPDYNYADFSHICKRCGRTVIIGM